jgi:uncharacterized BrkB/YihY/UPF0761 family membrane protein
MRSADAARAAAERGLARAREQRGIREALATRRWEQRTGAALLSGGLAYRLFLWLVPFGLVVAALLSFWVRVDENGLEGTARSFGLTGVAAHSATSAVHDGSRARWYLLIAGLLLMAWAGLGAVRALRVAARLAWGIEAARLRQPLRSSAVFSAVCVLGLAASVAASWTRHHLVAVGLLVTLATVFVDGALAMFALSHLPRPEGTTWRDLWPGALLVGVGITAVQLFLAYFLASKLESTPDLYGTLGAATTVLLVLFLIARLIVAGMFLNATLRRGRLAAQE